MVDVKVIRNTQLNTIYKPWRWQGDGLFLFLPAPRLIYKRWRSLFFWTMRSILILGTILLSIHTMGQTLDQKDLIEVVKLAFKKNKLPNELIPKLDTLFNRSYPDSFVVIKSNEKFGIKREYDERPAEVMVWDGEDIFLYNIPYWLTMIDVSRKKNKAVIRYETTTYGIRKGVINKCYSGEIKGKFDGEKWILVKSEFTKTDCNLFDWSEKNNDRQQQL